MLSMDTTRISRLRKLEDDFNLVREVIDSLQDAVEGYDVLGMFNSLCDAVMAVAPVATSKRGPKTKETVERRYKSALAAIERIAHNDL